MNPSLLISSFGTSIKKQVGLVLATLAVSVSLPVMAVVSLGGSVLSFLAGTPNAEAAATQGFYMGGDIPGDSYAWGNCTYWAFAERLWAGHPIPTNWGNANTWDDNARQQDYVVDHTPEAGAVFQTDEGDFGHVAYVTSVDPNSGQWTISEMNAPHLNVVSSRTFARSAANYYTFIHDKKGAAPWTPLLSSPLLSPTGK